jgi:cytochrome c heme-lyase
MHEVGAKPVETAPPPGCPMHAEGGAGGGDGGGKMRSKAEMGPVYNVYSQKIDPTNMMPAVPQQAPSPDQAGALSTSRVRSSIPKGGTSAETWLYPSPQMFYNALMRKGKAEGVSENDMDVVVSIHNAMNEKAWKLLLEWEEGLHKGLVARVWEKV